MIKIENLPHNYRHKVSGIFENHNFYQILDNFLSYGYKNNFNLTYEKIDISSKSFISFLYNLRLEHSENSDYYINVDYYDRTGFYSIKFSYKICGIEYSNSIETHSLDVVLSCVHEIFKLINRSVE